MTLEQKYQKCLEFIKSHTEIDTLQNMRDVMKDEALAAECKRFLLSIGETV